MVVQIDVQEAALTNWVLRYIPPSTEVSPHLTSAVNGGNLLCEGHSPFIHDIVQPNAWTLTVQSGTVITIELQGSNLAGLSEAYIAANTRLAVFTHN